MNSTWGPSGPPGGPSSPPGGQPSQSGGPSSPPGGLSSPPRGPSSPPGAANLRICLRGKGSRSCQHLWDHNKVNHDDHAPLRSKSPQTDSPAVWWREGAHGCRAAGEGSAWISGNRRVSQAVLQIDLSGIRSEFTSHTGAGSGVVVDGTGQGSSHFQRRGCLDACLPPHPGASNQAPGGCLPASERGPQKHEEPGSRCRGPGRGPGGLLLAETSSKRDRRPWISNHCSALLLLKRSLRPGRRGGAGA